MKPSTFSFQVKCLVDSILVQHILHTGIGTMEIVCVRTE